MKPKPTDEIRFGPEISPGVYSALRRQNGEIRRVVVSEAKEGAPLQSGREIAQVGEEENDGWYDLTSLYKLAAGDGPAQVATPAYRAGHDRIFGKKQKVGIA